MIMEPILFLICGILLGIGLNEQFRDKADDRDGCPKCGRYWELLCVELTDDIAVIMCSKCGYREERPAIKP